MSINVPERTGEEIKQDTSALILPDTNVWLAYYGVSAPAPYDGRIRDYVDGILETNRVRIARIVYGEFHGIVEGKMRDLEDSARNHAASDPAGIHMLQDALARFDGLYKGASISYASIGKRREMVYRYVNWLYDDIWHDRTEKAASRRDTWGRIKSRCDKIEWDRLTREEKDVHVSKGPPQKTGDQGILATAATLAEADKRKRIVIFTMDSDFFLFPEWIWRKVGVEILEAYTV